MGYGGGHLSADYRAEVDVIESVLARYNAPVRVLPPPYSYETSRSRVYLLNRAEGVRIKRVLELDEELDDEITRLRGAQTPTRFITNPLAVVIPKARPDWIHIRTLLQAVERRPGLVLTLGEHYDHSANPRYSGPRTPSWLRVDLSAPETPHMLIAGTTGSGKTGVMKNAILSLAVSADPANTAFIFIDVKATGGLPGLDGLPHLMRPPVSEAKEVAPLLGRVVSELFRRSAASKAEPHRRFEWPRIVIFLDELSQTIANGGPDVKKHIDTITAMGREVGIYLVAGTQKPSKEDIGPTTMSNMTVRAVGSVATKEDGGYVTGIAPSELGAHKLCGRGDFILTIGGSRKWGFQSAFIDRSDEPLIVQSICRWWGGRSSSVRIETPQPAPQEIEEEARLNVAQTAPVQVRVPPPSASSKDAMRQRHLQTIMAVREEHASLGAWPSANRVAKIHKELHGKELNAETAAKLLAQAKGG